jgi:predicted peptidase
MTGRLWVAMLVVLVSQCRASADTGFLDRSVTVGGKTNRYQVYVPADHSPKRKWPVVVNLHGNGAQGSDGLLPTAFGMASEIRMNRSRYPAIVLFPQAETDKRWLDGDMEELVIAELDRTMTEFNGDPSRVYLTGFSMGATGAYRIAYRWPTRFAAIVAIAGRVDTANAQTYSDRDKQADRQANPFVATADPFAALAERIHVLPIRIFHGDADETVPVEQSRRMLAALKGVKSDVQYQEYKGATHTGAADKAYADQALMTWLFAQHR